VLDLHEYRVQRTQQSTDHSSLLSTIVIAVIAFSFSASVVLFWDKIPGPQHLMSLLTSAEPDDKTPSFSGDRVGRAETAPLLKVCLTADLLGMDPDKDIAPGVLLEILTAARAQGRLTRVFGGGSKNSAVKLAQDWAAVTDCVYRANSWNLCDIDNRALAVQAANTFVVQVEEIAEQPKASAADQSEVDALTLTKSRVLDSLQYLARNGVLISSDFAPFAPSTVRRILSDNKPEENACTK
jgi:hypothetical protein